MRFEKVNYFRPNGRFAYGDVETDGCRVSSCLCREDRPREGTPFLIPGLIDMHIHGLLGAEFMDADSALRRRMTDELARRGTAAFLCAISARPLDKLLAACREASAQSGDASPMLGLSLEGPFISKKRCGALDPRSAMEADPAVLEELCAAANGRIRAVTVAPELVGAAELAAMAHGGLILAAGHTDSDYERAAAFFERGGSHLTHMYNAMPPLLHRAPGPIGAAAERQSVTAELIADGVHVHPSAVRAAFALFGPSRLCLISDAIAPAAMPGGEYLSCGSPVLVSGGRATLRDGITLAGGVQFQLDGVKNAVKWGIPLEDAVTAAALTPARRLGVLAERGAVAAGLQADLILLSPSLDTEAVFIGGLEM